MNAPQIAGRALVIQDGKLLMVRGDGDGTYWTLPGGRSELGENIQKCIVREVYEETGITVKVNQFFTAYEYYDEFQSFHVMQMIFHCTLVEGNLQKDWVDQGGHIQEAKFLTLDDIKDLLIFPQFLRLGEWLTPQDNNFYRGFERRTQKV